MGSLMKYVAFVQGWAAVATIVVLAVVAMVFDGWLRKMLWYLVIAVAILATINEHRRQ